MINGTAVEMTREETVREQIIQKKQEVCHRIKENPVVIVDSGKTIRVEFGKLLGVDGIDHMGDFALNKKRNFINGADAIAASMNVVFGEDMEAIVGYLFLKNKTIQKAMADPAEYSTDEFFGDVFEHVATPKVVEIVSKFIEDTYTINLDENSKRSKHVVNKELQFTDLHGKIILKASLLMKFTIPILVEYLNYFPTSDNSEGFFLEIFSKYFELFEPEGGRVNILNKIFKLIDSRIIATRYSDRVIWTYLQNISVSAEVFSRSCYRKVITSIIPKLRNNTNIVSFLHVVIRNFIRYQFTVNFLVSYKPLNLNKTDADGLSDFDKIEVNMVRIDESVGIINRLSLAYEIRSIMERFGIEVSEEEFDYYRTAVSINKVQTNLLFLFCAKYLGSYRSLYSSSYNEYVRLLLVMKKWLDRHNFPVLSDYLTAIPERQAAERKVLNKKQLVSKLLNYPKFDKILKDKYRFVLKIVIESGLVVKILVNLKYNRFHRIPTYEEFSQESDPPASNRLIDASEESLIREVVDLIELV